LNTIGSFFKKILAEKNPGMKDEEFKRLKSVIQMHLFVTFPACPLAVLEKIIESYLKPN
jgi:hypothetical protein